MDITDLRQLLADDADKATFAPVNPETVLALARRRGHRRRMVAALLAAGLAGAVAASVWSTADSAAGGTATLIPAASPSSSLASPRVVGITRPIVFLPGGPLALDPAGSPPASTASPQRLLAADRGAAFGGPNARTQLLYGAFTHKAVDILPGLPVGQHQPISYNHRLAVWIVDHHVIFESGKSVPLTFYTAVDPVTAKFLFAWNVGSTPPKPLPVPFPHLSPGPSTLPPQTGIVNQPGQFHGTWWQGTNAWVREVAPSSYLYVYAGGEPIDPSLRTAATVAGVLVVTPNDYLTGPAMSNGTRYIAPSAITGKLRILSVQGSVLTLQLVGTPTTYTFDTSTDAFSLSPSHLTYLPAGTSTVQTKILANGAVIMSAELAGQANRLAGAFGLRIAISRAVNGQLWIPPADPKYIHEQHVTLPGGTQATVINTDMGYGPVHVEFIRNGYQVDVLCDRLATGAGISGLTVKQLERVADGLQ